MMTEILQIIKSTNDVWTYHDIDGGQKDALFRSAKIKQNLSMQIVSEIGTWKCLHHTLNRTNWAAIEMRPG